MEGDKMPVLRSFLLQWSNWGPSPLSLTVVIKKIYPLRPYRWVWKIIKVCELEGTRLCFLFLLFFSICLFGYSSIISWNRVIRLKRFHFLFNFQFSLLRSSLFSPLLLQAKLSGTGDNFLLNDNRAMSPIVFSGKIKLNL